MCTYVACHSIIHGKENSISPMTIETKSEHALDLFVALACAQADKKRNRAKLFEFFTDTALECKKLNNFNSFMAISGE